MPFKSDDGATYCMNVVITGSTKGIGKAMAYEFLKHGDNVVISSRKQERVDSVIDELQKIFSEQNVYGITCDVGNPNDIGACMRWNSCRVLISG